MNRLLLTPSASDDHLAGGQAEADWPGHASRENRRSGCSGTGIDQWPWLRRWNDREQSPERCTSDTVTGECFSSVDRKGYHLAL